MSQYRRASRPADRRVIAGVATGLADHLGVPVWSVQLAFVVTTWLHGAGVIAYLLFWRFLPMRQPEISPGLESATRSGLRSSTGVDGRELTRSVALLFIAAGGMWLAVGTGLGLSLGVVVSVMLALAGVGLVWRGFDDATIADWLRRTRGVGYWVRMGLGVLLVAVAFAYVLGRGSGWTEVFDVLAAVCAVAVGLVLLFGPWIAGLIVALGDERRQRIRSEERADMAAHLHDSVLQTLTLLQRNADDAATVATLARRQERELRSWLFGDGGIEQGGSLAAALRAQADEVELLHKIRIEPVVVGDSPLSEQALLLVPAVREALVNAAKHSKADQIDLYAELSENEAEIFVRDRGVGFDLEAIPNDRRGIGGSIVERVERQGGTVDIRTAPGEGAEVHIDVHWRPSRDD